MSDKWKPDFKSRVARSLCKKTSGHTSVDFWKNALSSHGLKSSSSIIASEKLEQINKQKTGESVMIKKGDCVVNFAEMENLVCIGFVSSEPNDTDEHDLEFFDGGSVSPVSTSESFVVPERFARWLDKVIPQCED